MNRRVISLCLSVSLILLFAGCAGKKVASSSGDQSSQSGQAKTEAIQPEAIKTVPRNARSIGHLAMCQQTFHQASRQALSQGTVLGDVFFDFDRFQIRKDAMPVLDANGSMVSCQREHDRADRRSLR